MFRKNHVRIFLFLAAGIILSLIISSCSEKSPTMSNTSPNGNQQLSKSANVASKYNQVNLVSDVSGFSAARIDANLVNAWGIAVSPSGIFWISANHTGVSVVYDNMGNQVRGPVTIPTVNNAPGGAPTGVVFNPTDDFRLPNSNNPSRFIFVGEDGIVSAWGPSSGSAAVVAADQSGADAVYKGVDMATHLGESYLYAANFKQARVDVFDENFKLVPNMKFNDPNIPAGFAPFDIKNIHNKLFVTYAKQKGPDNMDDQSGPGNGFVDVYTPGGNLITRFASHGTLNSPWAVTPAPDIINRESAEILIGNFGDGRINRFNINGQFLGQLNDTNGNPVTIEGLWALYSAAGGNIYFTAGPDDENHGLFGYLQPK